MKARLGISFVPEGKGIKGALRIGKMRSAMYMQSSTYRPTRSRYAEFLKIDFPRLPLTSSLELFRALAKLGGELVALT